MSQTTTAISAETDSAHNADCPKFADDRKAELRRSHCAGHIETHRRERHRGLAEYLLSSSRSKSHPGRIENSRWAPSASQSTRNRGFAAHTYSDPELLSKMALKIS